MSTEQVNHPSHYGGEDNPYETIKVIEAWGLDGNFNLGNSIKYISRAEHKGKNVEDLEKARWYLDREIKKLKGEIDDVTKRLSPKNPMERQG